MINESTTLYTKTGWKKCIQVHPNGSFHTAMQDARFARPRTYGSRPNRTMFGMADNAQ